MRQRPHAPCAASARESEIVVSRRVNLGGVRSTPGSNSLPSICSMATSTALADQPDVLAWGDAGEQHHLLYPRQRPRRAGVNAYAVALPLRELPCQRLERLPARVLRLEPLQLYPMPFGAYDALPVEDVDERKLGVAVRQRWAGRVSLRISDARHDAGCPA